MLTEAEKREIEAEAGRYPLRRAASIEALKIAARRSGWVSDEDLREVAGLLGMTAADLDGIATFYNLIHRRPVGRHVIYLCNSISCWLLGCDPLAAAIGARLGIRFGETTADGRFTLAAVECLGNCDHAPCLMVDDDDYGPVTLEAIDGILKRLA